MLAFCVNLSREENPVSYTHLDVYKRQVPFCSEELNELMNEFVSILGEFGMTEIDDVIDTAIVRCGVKKSRREHARRLIETAFDVLLEIKGVGQRLK